MMNCPACQAPAVDDAKECQTCGIFFSKWQEREQNLQSGNLSRYDKIANATSAEFNWTILLIVCAVIIGAFYLLGKQAAD